MAGFFCFKNYKEDVSTNYILGGIWADCLGLSDSSTSDFFCPDCEEQRFGGTKDRRRSLAKRRSKGAPKTLLTRDHVTGRSTRSLQVPEAIVLGGCVVCK